MSALIGGDGREVPECINPWEERGWGERHLAQGGGRSERDKDQTRGGGIEDKNPATDRWH